MSMTSKLDARERVKDDGRSASFPRQLKPKKKKKMDLAAELEGLERELEILLQDFKPDEDCPFTSSQL